MGAINSVPIMETSQYLSTVDFPLVCCQEKLAGKGEDSYLYSFSHSGGIIGVFDGCGGSGAKRYPALQGHTGAYLASRAAAGAARQWFQTLCVSSEVAQASASGLKETMQGALAICAKYGGETSALKGSISKEFPTTAATIVSWTEEDGLCALCLWAGDSRCYQLDGQGLAQLTEDDLSISDPMESLTSDGVLTNYITTSHDFLIHEKMIRLSEPAIFVTATDGCFAYFSTPMEFEYLLLNTLRLANSPAEWEQQLKARLKQISGDDFSLCGMAIGYGSFPVCKNTFYKREKQLFSNYIQKLQDKTVEDRYRLWSLYREEYARFLS